MNEKLGSILKRLNMRIQAEQKNSARQVSLRELFGEGEEYQRKMLLPEAKMSIAESHMFPHGIRIWSGILAPFLYYALVNSRSVALTDSSSSDVASVATHRTHSRYSLTSIFRSWLRVSNILEEQEVIPDTQRTFMEMQSGPDIDCRLIKPKRGFYERMRDSLLPKMAIALSHGYDVRHAHDFVLWAQHPDAALPEVNDRVVEEVGRERVKLHEHSIYDRIVQTSAPVLLFPFKRQEWVSFPPLNYHYLYLALRRVRVGKGIEVIRFISGVFADNKYNPKAAMYSILGIDFQIVKDERSMLRGGTAGSSYDKLIGLRPKIRERDLTMRRGESTDVVADLTQEVLDAYAKDVELGSDWESIEDQALKLEVATRVIWQAIEAELDYEKATQKISDATLARINRGLEGLRVDNPAYPVQERIRKNILIAMFASPHRLAEYLIKSGLTRWFFPEMKDMTWQDAVSKVEAHHAHEAYRQIILNPSKETMRRFQNGWAIFDKLFGLQAKYPDKRSYLERVWLEATIK